MQAREKRLRLPGLGSATRGASLVPILGEASAKVHFRHNLLAKLQNLGQLRLLDQASSSTGFGVANRVLP